MMGTISPTSTEFSKPPHEAARARLCLVAETVVCDHNSCLQTSRPKRLLANPSAQKQTITALTHTFQGYVPGQIPIASQDAKTPEH